MDIFFWGDSASLFGIKFVSPVLCPARTDRCLVPVPVIVMNMASCLVPAPAGFAIDVISIVC